MTIFLLADLLGFVCSGMMILFIAFCVVASIRTMQKLKPREIPFEEVPEKIRKIVQRLVPDMEVSKVLVKFKEVDIPHQYDLIGTRKDLPIEVEFEPTKDQTGIREIEIEYEPRKSHRRWPHAEPMDLAEVPAKVHQAAIDHMNSIKCPLNEIDRVRSGMIQGKRAYELKSTWKNWRVEIRLLETGEVLMLELKAPRETVQ